MSATMKWSEPVCVTCAHCAKLVKGKSHVYEIDCLKNPNLGGVTAGYKKCPSFKLKL